MADDPALADVLMAFAPDGYRNRLDDPGPDEIYDTANVLAGMRPRNALHRLGDAIPANTEHSLSMANMLRGGMNSAGNWLAGNPEIGRDTLAPLGAGMMGAAAARSAAPIAPHAEPMADKLARWGKAVALHQRGEVKRGNPDGFLAGAAAFPALTAASIAAGLNGWPSLSSLTASGAMLLHPWSVPMGPHTADIRNIAKYLRGMELRESAKRPAPDNTGTTLY